MATKKCENQQHLELYKEKGKHFFLPNIAVKWAKLCWNNMANPIELKTIDSRTTFLFHVTI